MCFREDALAERHIVISGGCGAIGLGVVRKLTEHGASVTVNDIIDSKTADTRLRDADIDLGKTVYVQADLTRTKDVEKLIAKARCRFGPIHTALCHVGMVVPKPLLEFSDDEWTQTMQVNVKTAFLLGKASARTMLEDGIAWASNFHDILGGGCTMARDWSLQREQSRDEAAHAFIRAGVGGQGDSCQCRRPRESSA